MNLGFQFTENRMPKTDDRYLELMNPENVERAHRFHQSFPKYQVTPLRRLRHLADYLGIKSLSVKDESYRFGLNAFKVLGGSYAIARYLAEQTGRDIDELPYELLVSDELKREFGSATFFTATDGNHGRGVAWAAKQLGQKAVIRMPKGTTRTRLENIRRLGAEVTIEDLNYDDCVRLAAAQAAQTPNGVLVQDTAWDGYEKIPSWIMQGYGTLALEADCQLHEGGCKRPTHVFIQAGVGSLAGAVVGYFASRYRENPPVMVVVESDAANCLLRSAERADGSLVKVSGDLETIMAGLACGEGNPVSWDILKNHAAGFASCPDWMSARGTRIYAAPLAGDPAIVSGESGSVTMGLLSILMTLDDCANIRATLRLDESSEVLLVSTEGNTDPERYLEITWDGLFGTP